MNRMRTNSFVFTAVVVGAAIAFIPGAQSGAQEPGLRHFQPADIHRIKEVDDIAISPEGDRVAYRVETADVAKDSTSSDLYMVNWAGTERIRLTHTDDSSEKHPRFSPDGRHLAFIAARGEASEDDDDDPKSKPQVWLLNRSGGEAVRLTELPGGVSAFEWAPDSRRLVLVSRDPEKETGMDEGSESEATNETPPPIVLDRYQFKQDVVGYLGDRYQRLHVFDLDDNSAFLLTDGSFDSVQPSWSPDGTTLAFSSKRAGDPDRHRNSDIWLIEAVEGAEARQLTTWEGPDSRPTFSPDGRRIAYLRGGPAKYSGYDPTELAVISVDGVEPSLPTADVDRHLSSPQWSLDGKRIHFLMADDRLQVLASVPAGGGAVQKSYPAKEQPGVVRSFEIGRAGTAVVATFSQRPAEIYRVPDGVALSDHNKELRERIDWAEVEGIESVSDDGVTVGSMLYKPPGYREGVAYPTIVYVHGGPVAQDGFEFDVTSQVLAAQGYVVVNPNYRGSSGRGREFSRAIYADWGKLEIQDIHSVVDRLVEEGIADPERLGIGGWSYGGMNTNYAIATDTRFAAAVSGAGISNMLTGYGTDQYIWQYENEFGKPWESTDAYLSSSFPFFNADRIKTPTLFMCGEKDFNVPLINSEQMYQALRSLEVPTRLVIYPGEFHGLSKPSYIQDRLERMIAWYGEYIGGG